MKTIDAGLYRLINQEWTCGVLDYLMPMFSEKTFWIPFYLFLVWVLYRRFGKKTLFILLSIALAVLAADRLSSGLMKPLIGRVRPCHEPSLSPRLPEGIYCSDSGSMASSHAANHFAVAVFMVLLFGNSRLFHKVFWLLWASAIAYSRVYCGVHYPGDVLVGAMLGALLGYAAYRFYLQTLQWKQWK